MAMEQVVSFEKELELCSNYLSQCFERSKTWSNESSYYWKHRVESHYKTYISNDAFVLVARKMFESVKLAPTSQNYLFKFRVKKNMLYNIKK